jgi:Aspartyl protease/PDZ domain
MQTSRYSIIVFFLALHLSVSGQEEFITPSKFITKFHFDQFTGGVILLQARFSEFPDTLNFVLDTGSGGISLDSLTVQYFGLIPEPSDRTIRGIAGMKKVSFLNNRKLHFPGLTIDSLNFHVNDYSLLTSVYGERIDGIIGYSVLSRYILKINYDSAYIEFWTKGAIKYPRGGFILRPNINPLPLQSMRIRDDRSVNARFLYDMGAGLNMMLSTDFLKDSAFLGKKRKLYAKEAEGLGGKIDMHMTVIREIKLGPYKFKDVPIYVFQDSFNITSYPMLAGILGSDLLRRFNIVLNYDQRVFHLKPNSHYNDNFDYSYSGLELYYKDGDIIIGDVARDSPAEKTGLKEGDILIALNNNFTNTLQQMKALLQNAGRVDMIVKRNSELLKFSFKVKNIL